MGLEITKLAGGIPHSEIPSFILLSSLLVYKCDLFLKMYSKIIIHIEYSIVSFPANQFCCISFQVYTKKFV